MITKKTIRSSANHASYQKGVELHQRGQIEEFDVYDEEEYDLIEATVHGSGRNRYCVNISYDKIQDDWEDIDCECPAFHEYDGICKHCVAVLLEYVDYKERQTYRTAGKKPLSEKVSPAGMLPSGKAGQRTKQAQTTPSVKQLLTNCTMKRALPLMQDGQYGKVRIEPFLTIVGAVIQVEFKIGVTHLYVMKDVFTFAQTLENNDRYSYGQKLNFLHTMEAFEPESRALARFILNWARRNRGANLRAVYYGYSYSYAPAKTRILTLTPDDLDEFVGVLPNHSVAAAINGAGEREWRLTEDELPRKMTITGRNDGIQVKINYLSGYQSSQANIYFYENQIYRVSVEKIAPIADFLKCMADLPERTVFIQKEDIPSFCRELLPTLEKHFHCTKENFDEKDYGLPPVQFEIYLDAPRRDYITGKVLAVYGEEKFNLYSESEQATVRDPVGEIEIAKVVASYFNAFDQREALLVVEEDEDKLYELLTVGIPRMQELGEVYISDAFRQMKIVSAPKVAVGISVSGEIMELKLTAADMPKEQLLEILTKYNKKKKYYRLKNGDFVNIDGEEIEALLEIKQGLHLTDAQLKREAIEVPKYRALYLDAELKEKESLQVVKDKGFKALIRNMRTVEDNDFDIPTDLEHVLREYQKRGYLWIKTLKYNNFGGILADDMGLGKTLQVICFLLNEYQEAAPQDKRRTLIVCPASLVYNWKYEIEKFTPQLPVTMVTGTLAERNEILRNAGNQDILVTSYDLLKRDIELYEKMEFYCEIIDEAQYIKNAVTQAAKAVKSIRAGFRLALTGTPIENRLSELWSIFDYLMPGFLYSGQKFREDFEIPIVQNQEESAVKRLQKMISPFVLRRLKKDVLADLPEKLEESVYIAIEGEQQKLYDAHVKRLQLLLDKQTDSEFQNSKIQILAELMKLRQLCCDPALLYEDYKANSVKMDACMDLIRNAVSGGHKLLLFSQFTSMLEKLQKRLKEEEIPYYYLSGATSKENRAKMTTDFNQDDVPVFCISLKAGGTGLNLASADIVIHFDPWWNLAVQNQATDRAHRIGQKNVVNVYKLIVKGTIEENIMKIQEKKKELAEQVLSGEGIGLGSFTREDLLELLR